MITLDAIVLRSLSQLRLIVGKSHSYKYLTNTWTRFIHASTVVRLTGLQLGRYRLDVFLEPALEFEALQSGLSRTSDLRRPVAV